MNSKLIGAIMAIGLPCLTLISTIQADESAATAPSTQPTLQATAKDDITKLNNQPAVVEGVVSAVRDLSPRVLAITFKGNDRSGFVAVTFNDEFPAVHAYFAGPDGKALVGKTIDIHGTISLYQGKPEIILQKIDQVQVIAGPTTVPSTQPADAR